MKKINKKEFMKKIYDDSYIILDVRTVDQQLKNGVISVARSISHARAEMFISNTEKKIILVNHDGEVPEFTCDLDFEFLDCGFNIKNFG